MKRTGIIACLFALLLAYAAENAVGQAFPSSVTIRTDYNVVTSAGNATSYVAVSNPQTPAILTYIGNDGSITICSPDSSRTTRNVYIYEYTKDMAL